MNVQLKKVKDDFQITMDKMLSKANNFQGAAARIYPLYQKFQVERFQTSGSSEGYPWEPPKEPYRSYKKRRYGGGQKRSGGNWKSFPGAGTKTMIATSTLAGAIIGPGSPFASAGVQKHRVLTTSSSLEISIEQSGLNAEGKPFTYPEHVAEKRTFMKFSQEHIDEMKEVLKQFLFS